MDDKDDDKKRVLTPPADWADGLKPKTASNTRSEEENAEWQGNEDFQAPPQPTLVNTEAAATETSLENQSAVEKSASVAAYGYSSESRLATKLLRILTSISFIVAVALWFLWLTERSTSQEEISALQNTIRAMKRNKNEQKEHIKSISLERDTFRNQVKALEEQVNAVLLAQKSKAPNPVPVADKDARVITPPSQTGGDWFVNLESRRTQAVAELRLGDLRPKLLPMNISIGRAEVRGDTYYRIRASGFSSKTEASKASDWIEGRLQAGPFWIGKVALSKPEPKPKPAGRVNAERKPTPVMKAKTSEPLQLRSLPETPERWFIFVETYDNKRSAEILIREFRKIGLNAVSTVQSRSGELFYAVQVIDISSQAEGNEITERMRASGFKNARVKKQVN